MVIVNSECARNAHTIVLRDWPFGQIVNSTLQGCCTRESPSIKTRAKFYVCYAQCRIFACRGLTVTGFWFSATRVTSKRLVPRSSKGKSNRFWGSVRFNRPLSIQLDSQRSTNTLEYNCSSPSLSRFYWWKNKISMPGYRVKLDLQSRDIVQRIILEIYGS